MADGNVQAPRSDLPLAHEGLPRKGEARPAAGIGEDLHIMQADARAEACAQRLDRLYNLADNLFFFCI